MLTKKRVWVVLCVPLFLAFNVNSANSESNNSRGFLLTGPKVVLRGTDEQFCLHLQGVQSAGQVTLQLLHSRRKTVGSTVQRRIDPKKDDYDRCIPLVLSVSGEAQDRFHHLKLKVDWDDANADLDIDSTTEIGMNYRNPQIQFIQTDKAWYTPGQLVRFRTLTLNHLLQPIIATIKRVWFTDPSSIVVAQWTNVTSELGLAQLELQLSAKPVQGTWKIHVDIGGSVEIKEFEVKEYVLPRFEVTVVGPEKVPNTAETFNFSVCARYTFGQPVLGQVDVEVKLQRSHFWDNPIGSEKDTIAEPVKLNGTIDKETGCHQVNFPLSRLGIASVKDSAYDSIEIVGEVTEKGTEIKRNAIHTVQLESKSQGVVLEVYQHYPSTYKLGVPYIGKGKLFEGSSKEPVVNAEVHVCVMEGYIETNKSIVDDVRNSEVKECVNVTTNGLGEFSYSLIPTNSKAVRLTVEAKYLHGNKDLPSVSSKDLYPCYSLSGSFAVIPVPSEPVACNSVLPLKVHFNKVEKGSKLKLHYFATGRGDLLAHGIKEVVEVATDDVDLPGVLDGTSSPYQVSTVDLEIKVIPSFYPKAAVMVYYVREDGEVVTAQTEFKVSSCFPNPVTLQWNAKSKYPGATAELNLHSTPGSLCGLSVVDQSVVLTKPEAQLTDKTVLDKMGSFLIRPHAHPIQTTVDCRENAQTTTEKPTIEANIETTTSRFYISRYHISFFLPATTAFDGAGLLVMSNWEMHSQPCETLYKEIEVRPIDYTDDDDADVPVAVSSDSQPESIPSGTQFHASAKVVPKSVDLRAYFPETWLWDLYTTDSNGNAKIEQELPRRITSWVGRALCVSSTAGFGMSAEAKIEAFQPFLLELDLDLPYSIKRGEKLTHKVSVSNNLDSALPVKVTINPHDDFDIISASNAHSSCVGARDSSIVEFTIRPTRLGRLNITVHGQVDPAYDQPCGTGELPSAKDALVKSLLVESAGFPVETTLTQLVCPEDFTKDKKLTWNLALPSDLVNGSACGSVSVVGDLMGPALDGLTDLVRLPTGSGEPNMVTFTPLIFVIEYLEASKQLDDKFKKKAIGYMRSGYERELTYRDKYGSYSAFGPSIWTESVWLTAFVVKSFAAARKFISINSHDIDQSVYWILSKQLKSGCFPIAGKLLHKGLEGGFANGEEGLTAFTIISLLESKLKINDSVIENATKCIKSLRKMSLYTQALITYALVLSKDKEAGRYVDRLLEKAQQNNSNMWWERKGKGSSIKVETTSYALLALLKYQTKPDMAKASNIVRWLTQQRNAQGGFLSTQDTVMGLQALAAYATAVGVTNTNMTIKITADKLKASIAVQEKDKLVQKQVLLPVLPTKLEVEVEGKGCAVLQATVRYNVHTSPQKEAFDLTLTSEPIGEESACVARRLKICARYLLPGSSNMAILELDVVSGFAVDQKWLQDLPTLNPKVKRAEEKDNKIVLYFDYIDWRECVSLVFYPAFEVNDALPANVKISDYYEQEKFFIVNYTLPTGCAL